MGIPAGGFKGDQDLDDGQRAGRGLQLPSWGWIQTKVTLKGEVGSGTRSPWSLPRGHLKDVSKPRRDGWGTGRKSANWAARKDRTRGEVGR